MRLSTVSGNIEIGQIVQLFPDFPPTIDIGDKGFVKNGYAVTSGYAPIFNDYDSQSVFVTEKTFNQAGIGLSFATDGNGVWCGVNIAGSLVRSTDNGETWSVVSTPIAPNSAEKKVIATDGAGVWVCCVTSANTTSLIRSTNNGVSWSTVSHTAGTNIQSIDTNKSGVWIGIGTQNAGESIKSTDNGATWSTITVGGGTIAEPLVLYAGNQTWLVSNSRITTNDGSAWALSSLGSVDITAMDANGSGVVMVATGLISGSLSRSSNYGTSFSPISPTFETDGVIISAVGMSGSVCFIGSSVGDLSSSYNAGLSFDTANGPFLSRRAIINNIISNKAAAIADQTWVFAGQVGTPVQYTIYAKGITGVGFSTSVPDADSYYMRYK